MNGLTDNEIGRMQELLAASNAGLEAAEKPWTYTDGEENSSKEFAGEPGRERLAAMVKAQTDIYKWSFIFMGANIDAKAVGASIGVASARSLNYTGDSVGTQAVYEAMSSGTKGLRDHARTRGLVGSTNFVDDADAVIGAQSPKTKVSGTPASK